MSKKKKKLEVVTKLPSVRSRICNRGCSLLLNRNRAHPSLSGLRRPACRAPRAGRPTRRAAGPTSRVLTSAARAAAARTASSHSAASIATPASSSAAATKPLPPFTPPIPLLHPTKKPHPHPTLVRRPVPPCRRTQRLPGMPPSQRFVPRVPSTYFECSRTFNNFRTSYIKRKLVLT
jgi:hypothetical protein